jgi:hypothetical protein
MRQLQRYIIRFLLFFYLTSSYVSATHIHIDDTIDDSDCTVCIMVKNITGGEASPFDILPFDILADSTIETGETQENIITMPKGYFSHAPPYIFS